MKQRRQGWRWACIACAAGVILLIPGGCASTSSGREPTAQPRPAPPPAFAAVAAAHDKRVAGLGTLWARLTLRVSGRLADAELDREETEGHLQIILPRKVAISIMKLGETYFYLGSNDQVYWWLDLTRNKRAFFGRHERARVETVDRFGIPVHPLDLVELFAITPMPKVQGPAPEVRWSVDGQLLWYDLPARTGRKRVLLEPGSLLPAMVELLDERGKVVVRSELSRYEEFAARTPPGARPSVATRCIITVPRSDLTITINLYDPDGRMPREVAFDFAQLVQKRFNIPELIDLDSVPEAEPRGDKAAPPASRPASQRASQPTSLPAVRPDVTPESRPAPRDPSR